MPTAPPPTPVDLPTMSLDDVTTWMIRQSRETSPAAWVRAYREHLHRTLGASTDVAVARPNDAAAQQRRAFHIRGNNLAEIANPWQQDRDPPTAAGGLLADLLYDGKPRLIPNLDLAADDPAAPFAVGMRSAFSIPLYLDGVAEACLVLFRPEPDGFPRERLALAVLVTNLFNRGSRSLVLKQELAAAYKALDAEFQTVGELQRSLLPERLPSIPTLDVAAYYRTSTRAGGDYYDFFPLDDGRWGILIADVSGHGAAAAFIMAITHAIAHSYADPPSPGGLLAYVNHRLAARYTTRGTFITAFYAVYDPSTRLLTHASAGHNPPRLRRAAGGAVQSVHDQPGLPLGIDESEPYAEETTPLAPGDALVLYTDGITEARAPDGELFDIPRLDAIVADATGGAKSSIDAIMTAVDAFTANAPPTDDRTLVVARVKAGSE